MKMHEFVQFLSGNHVRSENPINEDDVFEISSLVSANFIYNLYEMLREVNTPMARLTEHLEALYDKKEYDGLIYLVIMLAESVAVNPPIQFYELSIRESVVPMLAAALIEDWLDIDGEFEEVEE